MPEETAKNIRIPVPGEEGKHTGHKIRTIVVSESKGIKALYCVKDKKIITYIFSKGKDWTLDKAKAWVNEHTKKEKKFEEVHVDQVEEFFKLLAIYEDGTTEIYLPNSPSFTLDKKIEEFTTGYKPEGEADDDDSGTPGAEPVEKNIDIIVDINKVDKQKQLIYGIFLVPEKADHDGDVIPEKNVEIVAHGFLTEYRTIDEMHKTIIKADIVESAIAWVDDLDFYGKKLKKGTWFGAIKVHDRDVWDKVLSGEYKAFSVRVAGIREPIKEGGQ